MGFPAAKSHVLTSETTTLPEKAVRWKAAPLFVPTACSGALRIQNHDSLIVHAQMRKSKHRSCVGREAVCMVPTAPQEGALRMYRKGSFQGFIDTLFSREGKAQTMREDGAGTHLT